jgi:hypothetical protein
MIPRIELLFAVTFGEFKVGMDYIVCTAALLVCSDLFCRVGFFVFVFC